MIIIDSIGETYTCEPPFNHTGEFTFSLSYVKNGLETYADMQSKEEEITEIKKEFNKLLNFDLQNEEFEVMDKKVTYNEKFGHIESLRSGCFQADFKVRCYCDPNCFRETIVKILRDEGFFVVDPQELFASG